MQQRKLIAGLIILVVVVAAVVGIVVAQSGHKDSSTGSNDSMAGMDMSASESTSNKINISNYAFSPATVKVKVGTTVTWTNQDAVSHTITADSSSTNAPSSMDIAKGQSYSFKFTKAGTYKYHCFPHPFMHGTVVVTN